MAQPQAEHARRVVGYYRSPESRLAYRLLLGGTKHFGYYPEGAGRLSMTAAMRRMDTGAFADQLKSQGRSVADFGDPQLVTLQGGLVIHAQDGSLLGGIGVGGLPSGKDDEDIARAGLKALGL